jgi:hypothetical protein
VQLESGTDKLRLRIRSGSTAYPDPKHWTDWQELEPGKDLQRPKGRFFQLAIDLTTSDPLRTPRLKSVRLEANPPLAEGWWTKLKVVESHNAKLVRSAIPFAHEPFNHPRLLELRSKFKLDDVVKDAETEFELITSLARWSASRWERGHLQESYPAWDALEILKLHADGKPVGGFCQQYNIIFLQACLSFAFLVGPYRSAPAITPTCKAAATRSWSFGRISSVSGSTSTGIWRGTPLTRRAECPCPCGSYGVASSINWVMSRRRRSKSSISLKTAGVGKA